MKSQWILRVALMGWVIWGGQGLVRAQQAPDTIFHNGKIVTVDNHEVNSELGAINEAIAIRDGKIVAVSSNERVLSLAGSITKSIDLKGRMVMPGIINTHEHPQDWDRFVPQVMKKVITDDVYIERFLDDPPEQQLEKFFPTLDEAVSKAKPGQWIKINLLPGKDFTYNRVINGYFGRQITKQQLDLAAPNNPVIVRSQTVATLLNQKAIEEVKKVWDLSKTPFHDDLNEDTGLGGTIYRIIEPDVMLKGRMDLLTQIYKLGLSWWTGYGITTIGTLFYAPSAITAYRMLEGRSELPLRLAWGWNWGQETFYKDPYFLADIATRVGDGSDYLWFIGGMAGSGTTCSTLLGTSPEVKARERNCTFEPGSQVHESLTRYVKAGGRVTLFHSDYDKDIDYYLDVIENASKEAGFTLDEIRAKRHSFDHGAQAPRPDQVERIKELGMMVGNRDMQIWQFAPRQLRNYGEQAVQWISPRVSETEGGVMNTFEIDRAIGASDLTAFWVLSVGITRKAYDGKVYAPSQRADRGALLKAATIWGAHYVLREKELGSLEPGKRADMVVLDKDYLTVPVDEILNIRVLMTMVGGKVVHLVPSLAREIGMQPTGAQVELGGPAAQW